MTESLISIIIPTYNRALVISETLNSLRNQSYTNWECIIVDDGSTDNTLDLVLQYCKNDQRFQAHERPLNRAKGANACRNYGFEIAKGEYINWFDSDDIMHVDFLKEKIAIMENNETLDFCCCINSTFTKTYQDVIEVERPKIMQSENPIEDYLLHGLYFYTHGPLWRRIFLENKELFDEKMHRSQESDFHFRMLFYKPKYFYLDKVLFFKRMDGISITNTSKISLKAQFSIFRYFDKVFKAVKNQPAVNNKNKVLKYVLYRQAVNFYNCINLMPTLNKRIVKGIPLGIKIINYAFKSKTPLQIKSKTILGVLIAIFTKKGYAYLYFPQFNYRSYNE